MPDTLWAFTDSLLIGSFWRVTHSDLWRLRLKWKCNANWHHHFFFKYDSAIVALFADCSLLLVSRLILPAVRHGADMSSIVHPLTNCPAHKPLFVGRSASRLQYLDIRFTSSKCLQKTWQSITSARWSTTRPREHGQRATSAILVSLSQN